MQSVNEGGTNKLLAQYGWDALSRAQSIAYGDGTSDSYSQYDAGDNLQTLTQTYNGSNNSVTVSGWSAPVDQSRGRVFEVRTDLRSVHLF